MSNLSREDFHVNGLVRDIELFLTKSFENITASLFKVDLLKKGAAYEDFSLPHGAELAIYITHVPELGEIVNLNLEVITLINYIELSKRNGCKRVIYIARLIDRPFIQTIQEVLESSGVSYTIILKDLAIGKGSVLDRYMRQLLHSKYLPYDAEIANVKFCPISALDLLRWIYNVDWNKNFLNEIVEIGGPRSVTVQEMFRLYRKVLSPNSRVKSIRLPRSILSMFYKKIYHINSEDYGEFSRLLRRDYTTDNSQWKKIILFSFTPLDRVIYGE